MVRSRDLRFQKPGPASFDEVVARVGHALRNIGDRIELNRNPLTRLASIERLAQARYSRRLHPQAVALREIVERALGDVVRELEGEARMEQIRTFLVLYGSGATVAAASRKLGISREHCSRTIRKRALALVAGRFVRLAIERRGEIVGYQEADQPAGRRRTSSLRTVPRRPAKVQLALALGEEHPSHGGNH